MNYKEYIEECIEECVQRMLPELILSKRILEGLTSVIDTKIQMGEIGIEFLSEQVTDFISQSDTQLFIEKRQPELSKVPDSVIEHIESYFNKNLKAYEITDVFRKSNHPDDAALFSVVGRRKDGYYACWTSWNENTQEVNHGHYGLNDKDTAIAIIRKNYNDITDEIEKYGLENSRVEIVKETQEPEREADNIIYFHSR